MLINKYKLTHKNKMVLLVSFCLLTLERCSFENISIVMLLFTVTPFYMLTGLKLPIPANAPIVTWKKKTTCALFQYQGFSNET